MLNAAEENKNIELSNKFGYMKVIGNLDTVTLYYRVGILLERNLEVKKQGPQPQGVLAEVVPERGTKKKKKRNKNGDWEPQSIDSS